ncbi:MAG TPA: hypothetical protein VG892_04510 [Terriglobales bacterium]|nr:hypothetical protein [Terriglobales bacterium]
MAPFPFLQRESVAEHARHLQLAHYTPQIELEGLRAGIDNVRHDVFLSPLFVARARQHLLALITRYARVEDMAVTEPVFPSVVTQRTFRAPQNRPPEPPDYKRTLTELLVAGIHKAKAEGNVSLDILLRLAVIKFLRVEVPAQFAVVLDRCRTKLKSYEGPRQINHLKTIEYRERLAAFQVGKPAVLRKVFQELFQTLREVEKETLARMRRALFGESEPGAYLLLLNRMVFTEDGRDDHVNAEQYAMLGKYERDPDRFQMIDAITREFLLSMDLALEDGGEPVTLDSLMNAPENAQEILAVGIPEESTPKGKAQKALLAAWLEMLERNNVIDSVIAAYESATLLAEYSPPVHAQQLKNALISKNERQRVERLLEEARMPIDSLNAAVRRAGSYRGADRAKLAGRFLRDFLRYHRDWRSMELTKDFMDRVNILSNDRLRELSSLNRTLYEFLLPEEQKPQEEQVVHHVILKADIRDSTTLTKTLSERDLNPASYFSLNFYDPINKLLPKYRATKVFIEGDAVILALFGYTGEPGFAVARSCVLAREMIQIVTAYNEKSASSGLPALELGIGISFQDSAPMYLMDENTRIMISRALNESDRLSSCNKGARKFLIEGDGLFNIYTFQTVEDEDTGGNPDEFLMRYNVGGINISEAAFLQLQQEISLQKFEIQMPTLWEPETVQLYTGLVPLGGELFHRIVVREGFVPHVEASDFSFKNWTDRRYFEVCISPEINEYIGNAAAGISAKK